MLGGDQTGCMIDSPEYRKCEVVVIPHVIYKSSGKGWIFPKNSALLPIFQYYVKAIMKEGALLKRIERTYMMNPLEQCQICVEYDGSPIGAEKTFSLFGLMFAGVGVSMITFL